MIEKKKYLVPKRRFSEFKDSGDWEQRKFEEIFKISQGLQIAISERFSEPGENRFFYITNEFLKSDYEGKYYVYNPSQNVVCKKDDILMTRTGNTGIVVTDVEGCFHNNFFKIKYDKLLFDKHFICQFLSSPMKQKRIISSAGSSTIPDLSHKSFYKLDGFFPVIEEQIKISSFFINLDNLITLHQSKLESLKKLKKSYLNEMFPTENELLPVRRFEDFISNWEQRKLGEISGRYDNLRIPITASNRIPGSIPYYGANGIQDYVDGFTHNGEFVLIAEDGANDLKDYPVQYVNGKVWVNNHAHVIQALKSISDNKFLKYSFKTLNIEPYLVGGGRAKLNANIMMDLIINTPPIKEQEIIGRFFKDIDNLITLHLRKLEKLKNIKKAYLNEMLV